MSITFILSLILTNCVYESIATLYPHETETREVKSLDGLWNFRSVPMSEDNNMGFTKNWFSQPLKSTGNVIPIAVPSSYQDLVQNREIMDNWGWVWYDRQFYVPKRWQEDNKTIKLRFSSVRLDAKVYLNGKNIVNHSGGQLPFEVDITNDTNRDNKLNLLTVAVNNVLSNQTLPQGSIRYMTDTKLYPKGFAETAQNFDFFNYAGIDRSVHLYAIPRIYIRDIDIRTNITSTTGIVNYTVAYSSVEEVRDIKLMVEVYDDNGTLVKNQTSQLSGNVEISDAQLWWPFTMDKIAGYLYNFRFSLISNDSVVDIYEQKVGIRTVKITNKQFLINGKPFYFRGFGKHEDSNIRGKGLDLALIVKDFNLIKWFGANSFRTSHYPYSEEMMDQADSQGIVVIDEVPATGMSYFGDDVLAHHQRVFNELFTRDKNRPSVVLWSLANEPNRDASAEYFRKLVEFARGLDNTRGFGVTTYREAAKDLVTPQMDVIMLNRYIGWYTDKGYTVTIVNQMVNEMQEWHRLYNKPVLASEFGADTRNGLHDTPSHIYSEDYQTELLMEYFKAFDYMRNNFDYFIGEQVWNFADFKCHRGIDENWGILTRERRPKAAAKVIRCRYWSLAQTLKDVADSDFYCPAI